MLSPTIGQPADVIQERAANSVTRAPSPTRARSAARAG